LNAAPALHASLKSARTLDMTDARDLLKNRKSISASFLAPPAPTEGELNEILTIASRVPDHGKLAPWRFILFRDDAGKKAGELLADLYARKNPGAELKALDEERKRLAQALLVIGVVSTAAPHVKIPEFEQLLSAGNAAMNILLAAEALGFAGQWTTGWIAYDDEAGGILGLRPGERFVGFVHIGKSTVPMTDRPRPMLTDVVTEWQPPA
jgi:nitroreductase